MNHGNPQFERFLRRAQLRWTVLRIVESIGICVLVGAGAALLLSPILIWRGQSSMSLALTFLIASIPLGLIVGFVRRPSRSATALEADKQFELSDLLTTALPLLEKDLTDGWQRTVLSIAEQRCSGLSPNGLVLNRFGVRAWSGIGLACAIALTMGLFAISPSDSTAHDRVDQFSASSIPQQDELAPANPFGSAPEYAKPVDAAPAESDEAKRFEDAQADSDASESTRNSNSSKTAGTGAGQSRSDTASSNPPQSAGTSSRPAERGNTAAAGAGRSIDAIGADRAGGGSVMPDSSTANPAWHPSADTIRDSGASNTPDSAVPDRYRDLVRSYFDRGESR